MGEFLPATSQTASGTQWSDDGTIRPGRELKHRVPAEIRPVPGHPYLVKMLRGHLVLQQYFVIFILDVAWFHAG